MKKHTLRPISVLLLAFLVVLPLAWVSEATLKGARRGRRDEAIEGAIKSVDPLDDGELEDGTQLTIRPPSMCQSRSEGGAVVKASFEEKGGQKVVTSLQSKRSRQFRPGTEGKMAN